MIDLKFPDALIENIRQVLIANNESIAVAESVSSGLLQTALSTATEALKFFEGGITAYSIEQKCVHLNVNKAHATATNAVSDRVASEMALGVSKLFRTNWGIGVTGYATPVPESEFKLFAFIAISHNNHVVFSKKLETGNHEPLSIQLFYVDEVLAAFSKILSDHP